MSAAVAAILEGMPEPGDLRMHQVDGRCVITAGSVVLFDFDEADIGMRNLALVSLRSLGFRGRAVAAVLGLTEAYVSTLWSAARRDGSAAVLSGQLRRGKPGTVTPEQWEQARAWRAEGASDAEIGRRLGVAHTTIGRGLGKRQETAAAAQAWVAGPLPGADGAAAVRPAAGPAPEPAAAAGEEPAPEAEADAQRGLAASRSARGMRGRCCCMRSSPGPVRAGCCRGRGS